MKKEEIDFIDFAYKEQIWRTWAWNFKPIFEAHTEANARAEMLIYLIENKLVEI